MSAAFPSTARELIDSSLSLASPWKDELTVPQAIARGDAVGFDFRSMTVSKGDLEAAKCEEGFVAMLESVKSEPAIPSSMATAGAGARQWGAHDNTEDSACLSQMRITPDVGTFDTLFHQWGGRHRLKNNCCVLRPALPRLGCQLLRQ